jgi:hypothetical protein
VSLMDAMSVRGQTGPVRHAQLHDGRGGAPGHRPGYAFSRDEYSKDETAVAYADYEKTTGDAWIGNKGSSITGAGENVFVSPKVGDPCTCQNADYPLDFGSPGTIRNVGGELVCVPNSRAASADDAATAMYEAYDEELRSAHKNLR